VKFSDTFSDEVLLELLKDDDRKAFECLYRKYWSRLYDTAYKRLKSREAVEEIIQDLFTTLWCKRETIQITHSFSTYIFASLKYRIINYIRLEIVKNKYIHSVKHTQLSYDYAVEESVSYNELNTALESTINDLPERCRLVFNLSRKENLSFKEIAAELNISINTVEKQIGKALKILRANLKDYVPTFAFLFLHFF
jgi:RNA polymerase sigma-70 factor (ECF subfamily)